MNPHERDLAYISRMRLMDDDFMSKVFDGSPECAAAVLNIILSRNDIVVESVKTQVVLHSLEGHSVRMDILARGADGVLFNVEIQRADRGAGRKRARYYSGLLDSSALSKGDDYENLPETYVIFITENDVLKKGKAVYRIERTIDGEEEFRDGSHILYVNGSFRDASPIGRLMHDFNCTDPEEIGNPLLQRRTRYFKETEEGVTSMCKLLEDMRTEAAEEAKKEQAKKTALNLYREHISLDVIARCVQVPPETVRSWIGIPAANS